MKDVIHVVNKVWYYLHVANLNINVAVAVASL